MKSIMFPWICIDLLFFSFFLFLLMFIPCLCRYSYKININTILHWFTWCDLCCWDKHHDQKQLGEEKIYFNTTEGSQDRHSKNLQASKYWSRDHEEKLLTTLSPMVCSAWFLYNVWPKGRSLHSELGTPTSITNKALLVYRPIWWRHFLNRDSLFPD